MKNSKNSAVSHYSSLPHPPYINCDRVHTIYRKTIVHRMLKYMHVLYIVYNYECIVQSACAVLVHIRVHIRYNMQLIHTDENLCTILRVSLSYTSLLHTHFASARVVILLYISLQFTYTTVHIQRYYLRRRGDISKYFDSSQF